MTKETALRIFGLDAAASHAAARGAHAALRAHLETRVRAAADMQQTRAVAFYRQQLHDLDASLEAIVGTGVRPPRGRRRRSSGLRMGVALLGVLALAWIAREIDARLAQDAVARPKAAVVSASQAIPVGGSARLGLSGNLVGAVAEVAEVENGEVVYRGPADGRLLVLDEGEYALRVEHEGCPDVWRDSVVLSSGSHVERLARNCAAHGLLTLQASGAETQLVIDGRELERVDAVAVDEGPRRVRVERSGHEPWEAPVDVVAGSQIVLEPALVARIAEPLSRPARPRPAGSARVDTGSQPGEVWLTHDWHLSARRYLVARYDRDRSGKLDSLDEIEAIPCSDWRGLEQSFDEGGLALSMTRFYGFDGSKWIEGAFGVSGALRAETYLRLKDCGLR